VGRRRCTPRCDRQRPLAAVAGEHAADGRLLGIEGGSPSLTHALRPVLKAKGVSVHGVYPAGIDNDMLAGIDAPKTPSRQVADGLLDGLAADHEDIFPDRNAEAMAKTWWSDPKTFERTFSGT
jgi:hypothetical protein